MIDPIPLIDHTLLSATAGPEQVHQWCAEAVHHGFAGVCVFPSYVPLAAELLYRQRVRVVTVIGFPCGATTPAVKRYEALEAVDGGAQELDVVINLGWLRAGESDRLHRELATIVEDTKVPVKAILELAVLTPEEQHRAVELCLDAGVAFLKTSTGWAGGATVAMVQQLRTWSRGRVGIKASGGIRTLEQVIALVEAGATRLGTSRSIELVRALAEPPTSDTPPQMSPT
jgi:deoxyribose-phosphate aldolase